jgi:hypothetical protein
MYTTKDFSDSHDIIDEIGKVINEIDPYEPLKIQRTKTQLKELLSIYSKFCEPDHK